MMKNYKDLFDVMPSGTSWALGIRHSDSNVFCVVTPSENRWTVYDDEVALMVMVWPGPPERFVFSNCYHWTKSWMAHDKMGLT